MRTALPISPERVEQTNRLLAENMLLLWKIANMASKKLRCVSAEDLLSDAYLACQALMRMHDPSRSKFTTLLYNYGPAYTRRMWLLHGNNHRNVAAEQAAREGIRPGYHVKLKMADTGEDNPVSRMRDRGADEADDLPRGERLTRGMNERELYTMRARSHGATLDQIGAALSLSKERVRQIEMAAEQKLSRNLDR